MLSIAPVNAATASHYYEVDDYYAKDSNMQAGQWYGRGAEALKLTGAVDKATFVSLLEGKLPDGQQLGRLRAGKTEHRPGMDLTFSAPKSVSIFGEVAGDKRIFAAHEKAVKTALNFLEQKAIQTRIQTQGQPPQIQNTESLVAALFQHDTSRNQDPQLHTHCIIMNMTQTKDGQWRSLTNEQIYESKMTLGLIYRAELAYELKRLGYEVEVSQAGFFEVKGVPKELITFFSSRRKEIEAAIERFDLKGAAGAAKATLNTRKSKQNLDRDNLKTAWQAITHENGFNLERLIPNTSHKPQKTRISEKETAKTCVLSACQHLTERESTFKHSQLIREACQYGLGKVTVSEIIQAVSTLKHRGQLVLTEPTQDGVCRYTTKEQVLRETEIRLLWQAGQGRGTPLLKEESARAALKSSGLNADQHQAANMILTHADKVLGVQGYAGTGKTRLLNTVRAALETNGNCHLIGLSPNAAQAQTLEKGSGIPSQTLDSFLSQPKSILEKDENAKANTLVIVDEASMISTQKMLSLLRLEKAYDFKVLLVGDKEQLPAVEAGKPFALLQKWGMTLSEVKEIVRQNESPILKAAIYDTLEKNIQAAFEKIGDNLIEVPATQLHGTLAKKWLALSKAERANTAVIVPDNIGRAKTNHIIREGLKGEGSLTGKPLSTHIWVNKSLTREQKAHVQHYQAGDAVVFGKTYKSLKLKKGEYYTVSSIDKDKNQITLQDKSGNTQNWLPHRLAARRAGMVSIYTPEKRELQIGEKIRWTKNFKTEGRLNAQTAEVTAIKDQQATCKLENGVALILDLKKPSHQHWDYAYVSTAHAIQGVTKDRSLSILDSQKPLLTNPMTFYIEISRAKNEAILIVDDKAAVLKQLQKVTEGKTAALEHLAPGVVKAVISTQPEQKALSVESELNRDWSQIYDFTPKPANTLLEKTKDWLDICKRERAHPIETWKTPASSVPWYAGDGMKDFGGQRLDPTTHQPEQKLPTVKKEFELTI